MNMKQEQLKKHIKSINKKTEITMFFLLLAAVLVHFTDVVDYFFGTINIVIFLMFLTIFININLKQKAIIRFITDSVGDN